MRNFDVFGLGQCCIDYVGVADRYPAADTKCELRELVEEGGGPVANALVALSRWGARCAMTGIVGDDDFGVRIRAGLNSVGIDVSRLLTRGNAVSQLAFIVADAASSSRTVFWRRPSGPSPQPDEIDYRELSKSRLLYTDGLFIDAALAAARHAREAGLMVVVDAGTLRDGMLALARLSDCYIVSQGFAIALVGTDNPMDACRRLAEFGPRIVGVTLGDRGAVIAEQGRIIERPALTASAVDTTGCGDVFHAGVTQGLLHGWPIERTVEFATWAAAMVACRAGGRAGIPQASDWTAPV